ncbi:MAG: restriction endonuclease [Defluviitaleaceae bacterium]|nr:restriction endonuclease [Defluviitaleaceae bacterium]
MFDYKNMKQSSNGMPTFDALIPVIMHTAMQKDEWNGIKLKLTAIDAIKLPNDLRNMIYDSGNGNIIEDRSSWALSLLTNAGLFHRPKRGVYAINDLGIELYKKHGNSLNKDIVESQPNYQEHIRNRHNQGTSTPILLNEEIISPQETIEKAFSSINSNLKGEILEIITNQDPRFFERLTKELLIKMGYGGALRGEGLITSYTNDGGIDVIIREDKLGFSNIYIQAKRYALDAKIGRPDVQAFVGAIARKEGKGLFITTASFTKEAREYAKLNHIVLVDGDDLADLMIEYNLGVSTTHAYEIKKIDSDFFEEGM